MYLVSELYTWERGPLARPLSIQDRQALYTLERGPLDVGVACRERVVLYILGARAAGPQVHAV